MVSVVFGRSSKAGQETRAKERDPNSCPATQLRKDSLGLRSAQDGPPHRLALGRPDNQEHLSHPFHVPTATCLARLAASWIQVNTFLLVSFPFPLLSFLFLLPSLLSLLPSIPSFLLPSLPTPHFFCDRNNSGPTSKRTEAAGKVPKCTRPARPGLQLLWLWHPLRPSPDHTCSPPS